MTASTSVLNITENLERQHVISKLLSDHGISIVHVVDSSEAVERLKSQEFDVIISETEIGQMDAWRLVRMVRANLFRVPVDTPFILITDTHCEHIAKNHSIRFYHQ